MSSAAFKKIPPHIRAFVLLLGLGLFVLLGGEIIIEPATSEATNESAPSTLSSTVTVSRVVDGDTIKIANEQGVEETIRVIGLNTPETVDPRKPVECFGREASTQAKLLLEGQSVTLLADASQDEHDKYDRLLRYVQLADGTDFGLLMIANGFAYEYTYDEPYARQMQYKEAQAEAQENNLGLWGETCSSH